MNIVNVGYDSANYYVVEQNGTRLLIDVGWPGTLPELLASLKRKSISLGDLSYLCVTHYHPDHAGLVQELKDKGLKHIVLEQQLAAIPQLKNYMKPTSGYVDILVHDSIVLTAAQSRAWLKSIGLQGEMVNTPGHSHDSISIVLDEGIAFTGDLLPPALANEGQAELIQQSWNRLRHLNVRTIYPGHGPARPML
jgi:glyoxylase-like metal-dependent hydrolase (beta-lactamase superfamily II)